MNEHPFDRLVGWLTRWTCGFGVEDKAIKRSKMSLQDYFSCLSARHRV